MEENGWVHSIELQLIHRGGDRERIEERNMLFEMSPFRSRLSLHVQ